MLLYNESSMLFPKIGLTKSINLILAISFYWNKFTIFANDSRYFVSVKYLSAFRWRRKLPSTWNVSYLQLKVVYRAFLVNLPISLVYFNDCATLSINNRWRNCLPICALRSPSVYAVNFPWIPCSTTIGVPKEVFFSTVSGRKHHSEIS